jgi:hypothetical protein
MVRGTVEETLNAMLDAEADQLCGAGRYERSQARQDTRAGSNDSGLTIQRQFDGDDALAMIAALKPWRDRSPARSCRMICRNRCLAELDYGPRKLETGHCD